MRPTYAAIIALTDACCRERLNKDYRVLARRMTAALCHTSPSPLRSGQPRTWACGIVYVLGQINFLTDPETQPYLTTAELCAWFGVGQSTAQAKARVISQALDTSRLNPAWSLPGLLATNPLVWMAAMVDLLGDKDDLLDDLDDLLEIAGDEEEPIPPTPAGKDRDPV